MRLPMALARRSPQEGLLLHSDRGSTYTSESYLALVPQNGIQVSMSRTANCYDNAVAESFFHSFKGECILPTFFHPPAPYHQFFVLTTQAGECNNEQGGTDGINGS
jgi:transposase InsO family protein